MFIQKNIILCCVEPLRHLKEQGKVGAVGLLHVELLLHVIDAVHLLHKGGNFIFVNLHSFLPSLPNMSDLIEFRQKSVQLID